MQFSLLFGSHFLGSNRERIAKISFEITLIEVIKPVNPCEPTSHCKPLIRLQWIKPIILYFCAWTATQSTNYAFHSKFVFIVLNWNFEIILCALMQWPMLWCVEHTLPHKLFSSLRTVQVHSTIPESWYDSQRCSLLSHLDSKKVWK